MMKKCIVTVVAVLAMFAAWGAPTVSDVVAQQRWPWNGLVDIDYTISGDGEATCSSNMVITAVDELTGLTYLASSFESPPSVATGTHRIVWNTKADGLHITSNKMRVRIEIPDEFRMYCVIDVSGGANAASYPVSYLDSVPEGGWSNFHKTDSIVMRWCPPGTYMMNGQKRVTLTKGFYIGIYEITQAQCSNVVGRVYRESVSNYGFNGPRFSSLALWSEIRGATNYPAHREVTDNSFMGRLRQKTGFDSLDLPTEAQWEYACRAGSITELYTGKGLTPSNVVEIAVTIQGSIKLEEGGTKRPNAWGLYDMIGNGAEICLDYWQPDIGIVDETDPLGPLSAVVTDSSNKNKRVVRGASWNEATESRGGSITSEDNIGGYTSSARKPTYNSSDRYAFRVCMTLE